MNYGQLRDFALQLIRQYSIAGTLYAPSYNNQQDYLNAIPNLVNDGLVYLATNYRPREAFTELFPEEAEIYGGYKRFTLPEDVLEMKTPGLLIPDSRGGEPKYVSGYKLLLPDYVLLPMNVEQTVILNYYRRPQLVPANPVDTDPIDAPIAEQYCVAYWVAAHLVMQDDAFVYSALMNEFSSKADALSTQITAELSFIEDAYGSSYSLEAAYV